MCPRHGDTVGLEAMEETACRGIDYPVQLPPCRSLLMTPVQFPNSGINTASVHPPAYYTTTALAAEAFEAAPGVDSTVTGARLAGILWLGAAAVVLWYVLASLGGLDMVQSPPDRFPGRCPARAVRILHYQPPMPRPFWGGALVLAATLRWEAGRAPGWLVPLAALVAVWLKFTNAFAVGAAVLYLAVRAWQQRDGVSRQQNAAAGGCRGSRGRLDGGLHYRLVGVTGG